MIILFEFIRTQISVVLCYPFGIQIGAIITFLQYSNICIREYDYLEYSRYSRYVNEQDLAHSRNVLNICNIIARSMASYLALFRYDQTVYLSELKPGSLAAWQPGSLAAW